MWAGGVEMLAPHAEECGQQRPAVQGAFPRREHYPAWVTCSRKTVRWKETHHGATVGIRRRNTRRWQKWIVGNKNKELGLKGGEFESPIGSEELFGGKLTDGDTKKERELLSAPTWLQENQRRVLSYCEGLVAEFAPLNVTLAAAFVDLTSTRLFKKNCVLLLSWKCFHIHRSVCFCFSSYLWILLIFMWNSKA